MVDAKLKDRMGKSLNAAQAAEIERRYTPRGSRSLSEEYGVSATTILNIAGGKRHTAPG